MKTLANVVAATTLIFAGYIFISSIPDLRRYIKISTM
jgi:hypothetical protein